MLHLALGIMTPCASTKSSSTWNKSSSDEEDTLVKCFLTSYQLKLHHCLSKLGYPDVHLRHTALSPPGNWVIKPIPSFQSSTQCLPVLDLTWCDTKIQLMWSILMSRTIWSECGKSGMDGFLLLLRFSRASHNLLSRIISTDLPLSISTYVTT